MLGAQIVMAAVHARVAGTLLQHGQHNQDKEMQEVQEGQRRLLRGMHTQQCTEPMLCCGVLCCCAGTCRVEEAVLLVAGRRQVGLTAC